MLLLNDYAQPNPKWPSTDFSLFPAKDPHHTKAVIMSKFYQGTLAERQGSSRRKRGTKEKPHQIEDSLALIAQALGKNPSLLQA